jgi:hypothetical protein
MKKITSFVLAVTGFSAVMAQTAKTISNGSITIPCSEFHVTIPLRDMPAQTDEQRIAAAANREKVEAIREAMRPKFPNFKKQAVPPDPIVQTAAGTKAVSVITTNFDGQVDNGSCPPDPDGAVGLTQYVQAINSSYQVFDKTGKALTKVLDLASLFPGSSDDGDPIVLYDKFADRWFVSEFEVSSSPVELLVAISQTGDATGAYYTYKFKNALWTTNNFPDYPKYSIWTDGYYETSQYSPEGIVWLDRARMLAGKSSASMVLTPTPASPAYFGGNNSLYSSAKTLDCDASALPPYGTPEYMTFFQNVASGGYSDIIYFYQIATDTAAKTVAVSVWDSLTPATFNAYFDGGSEQEISQPGAANSLDDLDGTFNFRVPFLVFTGYNSVVLSTTVNTGGMIAGIRWYEIRQDQTTKHFSIYQQGTYAPADGVSRWNGSIGMDQNGNIGLEYSVSSSTIYPSIMFTGRLSSDPLGTMTWFETTAVKGVAPAVSCGNRWGDYSELTLDPTDNTTFWVTNEYDKGNHEATRIFSFKIDSTSGFSAPINNAQFKVYQTDNYLNVIANTLPSNDNVQVDLFDIIGKQISTSVVKPSANLIQTKIPVNGLAKGTYLVRIGNVNYQKVVKVIVN